jgi:hypothetical protein
VLRAVVVAGFLGLAAARAGGLITVSTSVSSSTSTSTTSIGSPAFLDVFGGGSALAFPFPLEVALPFAAVSDRPFLAFFSGGTTMISSSSSAGASVPYKSSESDGSGDLLLVFRFVTVAPDAGLDEGPATGPPVRLFGLDFFTGTTLNGVVGS